MQKTTLTVETDVAVAAVVSQLAESAREVGSSK